MTLTITFYDIVSLTEKPLSPNTWKTRYCLNYKGLPHKTVWVEMCDIEAVSNKIGMLPTSSNFGMPYYSLPAIYDPNTETAIADSVLIAEYLDAAYPDTPKLFPPGTRALQIAFIDAFMPKLKALWQFTLLLTLDKVGERDREYIRRTREKWFGKKLEDFHPTGDAVAVEWDKVRAGISDVDEWLQKGKDDGPFFLGQQPAFADFVVASFIMYFKSAWGADSSQWKDVMSWNEGRWETYVQRFEKYQTVQ